MQTAEERAFTSAPPGASEHHTGYAVDIGTSEHMGLNEDFDHTEAANWLRVNAARYHFELSFPRNNKYGIAFEPWHYRFVGDAHSLQTFASSRLHQQQTSR